MVQIEDKDSALIDAIEMCGELQSELARAIIYDKNEYEILRRYYNLSASLQNAGINVNADIRILHKLSIRLKPRHFSVGFVFIPGSQCSVQL